MTVELIEVDQSYAEDFSLQQTVASAAEFGCHSSKPAALI